MRWSPVRVLFHGAGFALGVHMDIPRTSNVRSASSMEVRWDRVQCSRPSTTVLSRSFEEHTPLGVTPLQYLQLGRHSPGQKRALDNLNTTTADHAELSMVALGMHLDHNVRQGTVAIRIITLSSVQALVPAVLHLEHPCRQAKY